MTEKNKEDIYFSTLTSTNSDSDDDDDLDQNIACVGAYAVYLF